MNHIWLYRIILFWSNDYRCNRNIPLWTYDDGIHSIIYFHWIMLGVSGIYCFDQMMIDDSLIFCFEHMMIESTGLSAFNELCWLYQEYLLFWSNDDRWHINILLWMYCYSFQVIKLLLWTYVHRINSIIYFQWIMVCLSEIYYFEHMMIESTVLLLWSNDDGWHRNILLWTYN